MSQLTERDAEKLSPEQATALVQVLDLQARWDGLLVRKSADPAALHARQKANDALQAALRAYAAEYCSLAIPEPTQAVPDRLAVWCKVLRVVFRKAEAASPVEVMAKVYRLADRIAARAEKEAVGRAEVNDLTGAVAA